MLHTAVPCVSLSVENHSKFARTAHHETQSCRCSKFCFLVSGGKDDSDSPDHASLDIHEDAMTQDSSSGYHSNPDETNDTQQHLSSLELENRLLKNEVASLNQEMSSVIQRVKLAQDGEFCFCSLSLVTRCPNCVGQCMVLHSTELFWVFFSELVQTKKQLQAQSASHSQSDQIIRELRARENDLTEALGAKDAQLGILRVRLEEADKDVLEKKKTIEALTAEKDRHGERCSAE